MTWLFASLVMLTVAVLLGTDRLGGPLTDQGRQAWAAALREHDFPAARLIALRFAYHLTRRRGSAEDIVGRASLRLIRQGWDPNTTTLVRRLCRMVWSE